MKNFLAVFTGTPNSAAHAQWAKLDAAARQAREATGMKAWGDWMMKHRDVIVVQGGPLGKTKRTSHDGVTDISNNLGGFVVVRAESHAAAAHLFENHPHFAIFPGDAVEVMEVLAIPGQ